MHCNGSAVAYSYYGWNATTDHYGIMHSVQVYTMPGGNGDSFQDVPYPSGPQEPILLQSVVNGPEI